jgi:SAM-dependent MidA family methyltransferase
VIPETWPRPDADAAATSARLSDRIRGEIDAAGGWLAFERYMELALYAPGLGYYSAGSAKLGTGGDFVTAPEISDLFGRVLARTLARALARLDEPVVVELGAGTGRLAHTLLTAWDAQDLTLGEYRILELSADLRARQQRLLAAHGKRVRWLDALPADPFEGVVLANEVADALPVAVFVKGGSGARPLGVVRDGAGFAWREGRPDAGLDAAVAALEAALGAPLAEGYRTEICTSLPPWIASLAAPLARGALVLIDYGLSRRELYHASRAGGSLVCHYRHHAHDDPFLLPGLQDLSAWVDFSACAAAGCAAGLSVAAYTTQGQFLIYGGAAAMLDALGPREQLGEAQALKTLVLPGEMGERFKTLVLSRDLALDWPGRDLRDRL